LAIKLEFSALAAKEKNMAIPIIGTSEPTAAPAATQVNSKQHASQEGSVDKRAEATRAKKKKKRDTHRVALRRSHTKG
jgi:hypothetical protein